MAEYYYYREELSMLMRQIADYSAKIITAKTKRERKLLQSDIDVATAELEDCYRDFSDRDTDRGNVR